MRKSIMETRKLFTIEGIKEGNVDIRTSDYLLSLSKNKQVEVLSTCLKNMKKDISDYESMGSQEPKRPDEDVDKTQLRLLIQIVEGLLEKV